MSDAKMLKAQTRHEDVKTGLEAEDRKALAKSLSGVLSDRYLLVVKTHIYHWNVVGPLFHSVHVMSEDRYTDISEACAMIAERVCALGFLAPVEGEGLLPGASVKIPGKMPSAGDMVEDLIADHEILARNLREAVSVAETRRVDHPHADSAPYRA